MESKFISNETFIQVNKDNEYIISSGTLQNTNNK